MSCTPAVSGNLGDDSSIAPSGLISYINIMARTPARSIRVRSASKGPRERGAELTVAPVARSSQPTTSEVFDTYWKFAYERHEVYFRRLEGWSPPWTADPILRSYRFTSAYRAADRVSQYLIRHVLYVDGGVGGPADLLFRVLVFKFFNRISTWELLSRAVGGVRWSTYSFREYDRVLTRAIDAGQPIYSAAYIMPACSTLADGRKHRGHLRLIEKMVADGLADRLAVASGMAEAFALIRAYPMMGDFLAFQYAIDVNYSELTNFSESDFVIPGPGARDGLRKVFADPGDYSEADLIRWVADRQDAEFDRLGLPFRSLWGRRLQLIDCQNLFCEVGKYARVHHPRVPGLSGRTRIKQRYASSGSPPRPWFPPKWGLNGRIKASATIPPVSTPSPDLLAAPG